MNGEIGRIDGSLGLSLERPGLTLEFGPHERTLVRGGTSIEREIVRAEIVAATELLDVEPDIEILIRDMIPPHQGLGSGTQTRLAILSALNHRFELNHSLAELSTMSTRGGTSGIGINTFRRGGMLLDGGHSVSEQKSAFAPSRFATKAGQPPLLMRSDFPKTWGIALFIPNEHRGLSGQDELDFMLANTPLPLSEVQSASHIILMRLLPALRELDLETFGSSVSALQDVGWKRRHWIRDDNKPLQYVRRAFNETTGLQGCGLSSTGATVFGFYDTTLITDDELAGNLQKELHKGKAMPGQVVCTRANNCGMRMDSVA